MANKRKSDEGNLKESEALSAAREWMALPPPGLERLAQLPVPELARHAQRPRRRWVGTVSRAFAAAAVLALVFGFGYRTGMQRAGQAVAGVPTQAVPAPSRSTSTSTSTTSNNVVIADSGDKPAPEPEQFAREEDGKVLIDTRLRGNGAHVTWVVDGSFQLAQSNATRPDKGDYQ